MLDAEPDDTGLERLSGWLEQGLVRPVIDRVHPLAETPEAMRYLVEEHASAKVVIAV